jgi:CRP-like cAMP-binding protein
LAIGSLSANVAKAPMALLTRVVKDANQLLNSIAVREREQILAECATIPLPFGRVLYESNDAMRYVYFPTSGFVSLISQDGAKHSLEVGLVGAEGMVGSTLALGVSSSPLKALIQGQGSALRMRADSFADALNEIAQLRQVIGAYLFVQYAQVAQTATCGRFHALDARLARWILLTQDRAGAGHFRLTHELLAQMLGVRRAGVTMAAGMLQKRHLIQYRRGIVAVLNRPGLEALACACYKHLSDIYGMHVATTGKRV